MDILSLLQDAQDEVRLCPRRRGSVFDMPLLGVRLYGVCGLGNEPNGSDEEEGGGEEANANVAI